MIDVKKGEISFKLDHPIKIAKDGGMEMVDDIEFTQPTRRQAASFEVLASLYSTALMKSAGLFKDLASEEDIQKATAKAEEKKGKPVNAQGELEEITYEGVMEEVEGFLGMLANLEFDFEKAYKIFEKMICYDGRFCICKIGGIPFKESWLDQINYRDYKKMMAVYITFFGESVKSGTTKDSELPSDSHTEVKTL